MRWSFKKNKELRMVGILIVSHGRLAEALISSVQFLVGNLKKIRGVSIRPKGRQEEHTDRIQKKNDRDHLIE
jgi:mannose/fructose-specific phosphotransferase system component IIA